jgi:hypothetical protein
VRSSFLHADKLSLMQCLAVRLWTALELSHRNSCYLIAILNSVIWVSVKAPFSEMGKKCPRRVQLCNQPARSRAFAITQHRPMVASTRLHRVIFLPLANSSNAFLFSTSPPHNSSLKYPIMSAEDEQSGYEDGMGGPGAPTSLSALEVSSFTHSLICMC